MRWMQRIPLSWAGSRAGAKHACFPPEHTARVHTYLHSGPALLCYLRCRPLHWKVSAKSLGVLGSIVSDILSLKALSQPLGLPGSSCCKTEVRSLGTSRLSTNSFSLWNPFPLADSQSQMLMTLGIMQDVFTGAIFGAFSAPSSKDSSNVRNFLSLDKVSTWALQAATQLLQQHGDSLLWEKVILSVVPQWVFEWFFIERCKASQCTFKLKYLWAYVFTTEHWSYTTPMLPGGVTQQRLVCSCQGPSFPKSYCHRTLQDSG